MLVKLARGSGVDAFGVDLSYIGALTARKAVERNVIAIADGEFLPFPNESMDFVTIIGSLEHFPNPSTGIQEIRRILRKNGRAALVLPNSYYLVDIIWQVWRTGYSPNHKQSLERFASFREWYDFIEENGLKIHETYKYNFRFPTSKPDLRWYLDHPRKIFSLGLAPFIPFNLSYHFVYICTLD
jgi:SAM-dependent methyltransferase